MIPKSELTEQEIQSLAEDFAGYVKRVQMEADYRARLAYPPGNGMLVGACMAIGLFSGLLVLLVWWVT